MSEDRSIEEIYQDAEFGHELGYGDAPALVVIDLQHGFTHEEYAIGGNYDDVLDNVADLVDTAHDVDIPVVFARVVFRQSDMADAGIYYERHPSLSALRAGTKAVEIDDRLDVREDDYILDKKSSSIFHDTELNSVFRHMGVDTVIITGCNTSGCIRSAGVDACQHGYYTVVVEDCVGDRHERPHRANLFDLKMKYADVKSKDEVTTHLRENVAEAVPQQESD